MGPFINHSARILETPLWLGRFVLLHFAPSSILHSSPLQCSFTETPPVTLQPPTTILPILAFIYPTPPLLILHRLVHSSSLYFLSTYHSSMARSTASMAVVFMVSFLLVSFFLHEASAITCGQVYSYLAQCIPYVRNNGPLAPACCAGVHSLNSAAKTTPDRQAACNCLKTLAGSISGLNPRAAAGIPGKCGVNVGYAISTSTDCTK
ncbi:Non-specific lipid-transfer protein [Dendrobium catenatum]|uniref:Non-specific lipid-transfer protein n=2 Tax=Dendrobium catenatum TaxID=906689 RepID=A0A2I0WGQ0_9ASPA|nr:Non-specific lipid-transfer protein [Dendrobium catenatum]